MDSHTACLPSGRLLDVTRLIQRLHGRRAFLLPLAWLVQRNPVDRSRRTGFSAARYLRVDLRQPLVLDERGRLIDGRHRLAKLTDLRAPRAPVVKALASDLDACTIDPFLVPG